MNNEQTAHIRDEMRGLWDGRHFLVLFEGEIESFASTQWLRSKVICRNEDKFDLYLDEMAFNQSHSKPLNFKAFIIIIHQQSTSHHHHFINNGRIIRHSNAMCRFVPSPYECQATVYCLENVFVNLMCLPGCASVCVCARVSWYEHPDSEPRRRYECSIENETVRVADRLNVLQIQILNFNETEMLCLLWRLWMDAAEMNTGFENTLRQIEW